MSIDDFESTAAGILCQIQASLQEYVRLMNESGARVRRESDEAHRQHDEALKSLELLATAGLKMNDLLKTFFKSVQQEWPNQVARGAHDAAAEAIKRHVESQMSVVETRLHKATHRLELLSKSLGWKQLAINGAVAMSAVLLVGSGLFLWFGK